MTTVARPISEKVLGVAIKYIKLCIEYKYVCAGILMFKVNVLFNILE